VTERNRHTGLSAAPVGFKYMRTFAEAWPSAEFVQGALAQLPWYHHLAPQERQP
jgi:hypothetical protein